VDDPDRLEVELGRQLRILRLRLNLNQRQLADQAGIALNVVKNLEGGRGSTIRSLAQVLRVIDRADWLRTLAPAVSISPVQMLRTKAPRLRASRQTKEAGPAGEL